MNMGRSSRSAVMHQQFYIEFVGGNGMGVSVISAIADFGGLLNLLAAHAGAMSASRREAVVVRQCFDRDKRSLLAQILDLSK
jgi:hypothetical protein